MTKRLLREPLLHFLALGAAILLLSGLLEREESAEPQTILVTEGRIDQLIEAHERTWRRPPSIEELRALVEAYVREEVYYREAVLLGLDRDDTIVRRRMQQKMEFLATLQADAAEPEETELRAFYEEHPQRFREPPEIAFSHVFVSLEVHGEEAEAMAGALLAELRQGVSPGAALELGDPFLLPPRFPLAPLALVERNFGGDFASAIAALPVGSWDGPVVSTYGLHLVLVEERRDGRLPPFEAVRAAVDYEWRAAREKALLEAQYEALRANYRVVIEGTEEKR